MTTHHGDLPPGRAVSLTGLLALQPHSIASRVLARSAGGNVTLFTLDAGEGLSEHSSPYDALAIVLEGRLALAIGGTPIEAGPHDVVRLPATIPHALQAVEPARMLLVMLREPAGRS